jgi:hypothetical protein
MTNWPSDVELLRDISNAALSVVADDGITCKVAISADAARQLRSLADVLDGSGPLSLKELRTFAQMYKAAKARGLI